MSRQADSTLDDPQQLIGDFGLVRLVERTAARELAQWMPVGIRLNRTLPFERNHDIVCRQ